MKVRFTIKPTPPFRLDWPVWILRRRANNRMDLWDGCEYRRCLLVGNHPVLISATQTGSADEPVVRVVATGEGLCSAGRTAIRQVVSRMLGAHVDLSGFYAMAGKDPPLQVLAARFRGMKPPRFTSLFETLVNGISCQQISLVVGLTVMNRLAAACGPSVGHREKMFAFPEAAAVAKLSVESLRAMGYNRNKSRAILGIAKGLCDGSLDLGGLDAMDDRSAEQFLRELPGIGPWTAQYTLLRGLGRINVFPGGDVGAKNGLQRWLNLESLTFRQAEKLLDRWHPYGGLIYFHLLLRGIDTGG